MPALPPNGLRIVPLGGLGEIGRTMTVFEHAGRLLIVDCGVLFPDESQPGVDVILPDFSWIRDRLDKVDAIVLTHGHEDHIGGVPYLLRERPGIPVLGSRLTLALLEAKLVEHKITPATIEVAEGDRRKAGPFDLEFVAVNHSIPDGPAVAIRTGPGWCCTPGTSRWTSSPSTVASRTRRLRPPRRGGVDLFLVDSTNAECRVHHLEGELAPAIDTVFRTKGRVIVSSFASHVHRIQQVLDTAHRHGRKVAFVALDGAQHGHRPRARLPQHPDGPLVKDLKALERLRPDQMTIIATGSQGEPMAALARMANRDHPVEVTAGDTVLMASSLIPGNENAIYRVINELTRWGATVVHKGNAKVHVSGHASAGELLYCFNIIRPTNVLPVHGEWRHLRANADIAIRTGVDPERVLIAQDGSVIDLVDGRARITGTVPAGLIYVDSMTVGGATEETLHVRRTLAEEGVVTIVCIVDPDSGELTEDPDYLAHGFPPEVMDFSGATPAIQRALTKAASDGIEDLEHVEDLVRRAASAWAHRAHRRSPLVIPVIVDA